MVSRVTSNVFIIIYVVLYKKNKDNFVYRHIIFIEQMEHRNVNWHYRYEIPTKNMMYPVK